METPKEQMHQREHQHGQKIGTAHSPTSEADPGDHAQQQGDGQPENARELEDRSSGSAQASTIRDD